MNKKNVPQSTIASEIATCISNNITSSDGYGGLSANGRDQLQALLNQMMTEIRLEVRKEMELKYGPGIDFANK